MARDTRTAALVSSPGSIDWMCFPRFDSPPVFGALVGGDRAGRFAVELDDVRRTDRRYLEDSVLLETTWATSTGEARLLDGMVADTDRALLPQGLLVRALTCTGGRVRGSLRFAPAAEWGDEPYRVERRHGRLVCLHHRTVLTLATSSELRIEP